jgi:hypothetical protein
MPVARNLIRFSRSQFVSGRTPSNIAGRETAPYGWIDGTYAEFVIAIADLGHYRCSTLACLACLSGSNVAKYSIRSR